MRSNKRPTQIKEILKKTIEAIEKEGEKRPLKEEIEKAWEEAAGKQAARHSQPKRIKENILTVTVDSPTWIYQLDLNKEKIEKKITKLLNEKKQLTIRLRVGEKE